MQRTSEPRARACGRRILHRAGACLAVWGIAEGAAAQDTPSTPGVTRGRLTVSPAEYFECANENAFVRGEPVLLTGGGFLPGEEVAVTLDAGDADLPVAEVRATPRGGLSATVTVPTGAPAEGELRMLARAEKGEAGGGVVLRSPPLRIFPDTRDSDGDGFQDRCDTCPGVASSALEDDDADGLGNVCDACPNDANNDSDGDGLCAEVDPNPYAPEPKP